MITLKTNTYNKRELEKLTTVLEVARNFQRDSSGCNAVYGSAVCKSCISRHLCYDLESVLMYANKLNVEGDEKCLT